MDVLEVVESRIFWKKEEIPTVGADETLLTEKTLKTIPVEVFRISGLNEDLIIQKDSPIYQKVLQLAKELTVLENAKKEV